MDVLQITPNHADHISYYNDRFLLPIYDNDIVVAQPKYDGERMLVHYCKGEVACTSRRYSKKTNRFMENQDKLPILQEKLQALKDLDYTVVDCECYAKDWSTIVGILHSLPDRAVELQKSDTARFAIFDCLFYDGKDLRDLPYVTRLKYAKLVTELVNYEPFHFVKFMNEENMPDDVRNFRTINTNEDWKACMQCAIDEGFEGIVIKPLQKHYYDKGATLKCKKFETVDCVVIGYQPGRGKYEGLIGALEIGYYDKDNNKFVKISNVNCSTDEERKLWSDNWTTMKCKVIEVKCQEITEKSLRHPVYVRLRDDKDYTMCTKETIFKEEN